MLKGENSEFVDTTSLWCLKSKAYSVALAVQVNWTQVYKQAGHLFYLS